MKISKSKLKGLIFEEICKYYQDNYRKNLLKEGWFDDDLTSADDEPYKPDSRYSDADMNNLQKAIEAAVEMGTAIQFNLQGKDAYAIGTKMKNGLVYVVIKWENAEAVDDKYGKGWEYVEGSVNPDIAPKNKIDYLIFKVRKKLGILKEEEIGGAELPDATDQILAKFPTLRHAIEKLQTENFKVFVSSVDWISPKPSEFRINLANGQNYTLKWMGDGFEATIGGKPYMLNQITGFQQALNRLSDLYKEGPIGGEESSEPAPSPEPESPAPSSSSSEPASGPEPEPEPAPEEGADVSGENIDFEEPAEA